MSMPEFPDPNPDFSQEQALTMILSSIALEELSLSHIINAEAEKIQYVLKNNCCQNSADAKDILAVNKSVKELLDTVLQNQIILKNKMDKVLEYLPQPPAPPVPPCPPEPCNPSGGCCSCLHCCRHPCRRQSNCQHAAARACTCTRT